MNEPSIQMKRRLFSLFVMLIILYIALIGRLGYVQVVLHDTYSKMALDKQTRKIVLPAVRGEITDRNNNKLAFSIRSYSVAVMMETIKKDKKEPEIASKLSETALKLSPYLNMSQEEILKVLQTDKNYVKISKEKLKQETALQIKELHIPGVKVEETVKRIYPKENLAAHVLGVSSDDGFGISGIEYSFEKELAGKAGLLTIKSDAKGRQLPYGSKDLKTPENGQKIVLTIDEIIQHYMEKALDAAMVRTQANGAVAIMLDIKTGEVLGMVSKPDFDPNSPRVPIKPEDVPLLEAMGDTEKVEYWNNMWKNRAVNALYEPGSTFKLITGVAGLDTGAITMQSTFQCDGSYVIDGERIRCWTSAHGHQTFSEAAQNSCNPAFMQIGQKIGIERYYEYLERFHIKDKTGIELPGESAPLWIPKDKVKNVEFARMNFGYSVSVNPMRMVTAIASIGNKGNMMEPHIVKYLKDSNGKVIKETKPKVVSKVMTEKTAAEMLQVMESVVTEGGGIKAFIQGYRIGGKTGTSNKLVNGRYDKTKVNASFAAIAPLDDPKIALLIVVDEPKTDQYGSKAAAPIAHEILRDTLAYLEIPPQYSNLVNEVPVPNLVGKTLAEAKSILSSKKLNWVLPDNLLDETILKIDDQYPKAGDRVMESSQVILYPKPAQAPVPVTGDMGE